MGKTNDKNTWSTFWEALEKYNNGGFSGLGFVFSEGDGIAGIDLDHCFENGEPNKEAKEILEKFQHTYAETSPSGEGLRIFCLGCPQRRGKGTSEKWVEVYDHRSPRYLTVTGNNINKNEITSCQDELDWLHEKYMKPKDKPKKKKC